MLRLEPRYLERLDPSKDRMRRMFETLGARPETLGQLRGGSVIVSVPDGVTAARRLAAAQLVDLLVRLQPVVGAVYIDAREPRAIAGDLERRFPLETSDETTAEGVVVAIAVGAKTESCDILIDGAGWCLSIGEVCAADDDGNPIGPMAIGAVGAAEAFKVLFGTAHPGEPLVGRFMPHTGPFSLWDRLASWTSPALPPVHLDAILVGVGGVGAGIVTTLGALGERLDGRLVLVDDDPLDIYNFNRVTYARVEEAEREVLKVESARDYLSTRVHLDVEVVPEQYRSFTRRIRSRIDRRYPLVMMGVDQDAIRWEVQRDLPKVLIDGATGNQGNCRIDTVQFGEAGCIGCSRPPRPRPAEPAECDAPPALHAPSISFLSAFAGTVVAGEAIRVATTGWRGPRYLEHTFAYPLNPDLAGVAGFHAGCPVDCRNPMVLRAYRSKWGFGEQETSSVA